MTPVFRSLRWRLQLWHGLVLVTVVSLLGVLAHRLAFEVRMQAVDHELQRRLSFLQASLMRPMVARTGQLPPEIVRRYAPDEPDSYYFIIWNRDGSVAHHAPGTSASLAEPVWNKSPLGTRLDRSPSHREFIGMSRTGQRVLVGKDIQVDREEMRRLAWWLAGLGSSVLAFGALGGWWAAGRALRPVRAIGAAAARLAEGKLDERIDVTETHSELGQLAGALNHTFDRLQAAFDRQARFTADASHELRTPLAVILAQTQTALRRPRSEADYRLALEACERAARRMQQLSDSLLVLARQDAGDTPARHDPLDLADLAAEAADSLRPLATSHGLALDTRLAPAPALGDPAALAQVIANLVTNAITYNRPDGRILLLAGTDDSGPWLAVQDTGIGISPADLPFVFDRFYRVDKARQRAEGHAGLGLAIAQSIARAHHGSLHASSEPGQGSTFTLRLPLRPDPPAEPPPA